MAGRGLKTKIAFNVAILLLISAVVTDILVFFVMHGVMIRHEVERRIKKVESIGNLFFATASLQGDPFASRFETLLTHLVAGDDFALLTIHNSRGDLLFEKSQAGCPKGHMPEILQNAIDTQRLLVQEHGAMWALLWRRPQFICMALPVYSQGQLQGAIGAMVSLEDDYIRIAQYHKPIVLYLLINTVILTLIGLYRIFRIYLRPIDRIVLQADAFHEHVDLFFAFRQEDNELNRLASALNRMLRRITDDKKVLEQTVMSLERANAELKNAQKEVLRAEKLASVGRLAAGVAHEIGNPIGIVLGYLEMLKQNDLCVEDKIDFLRRSEEEIQRINVIIRQLLDLARHRESQAQPFSLHACLLEIVDVMRMQPIMSGIVIETQLSADRDEVWGNDEQMRQVFLNLLLNAADAIKSAEKREEGRIIIQSHIVASDNGSPSFGIQVVLSDNGVGMSAEQLQNIFDPFYTTKEAGKGTGLGLAVSYMIVDGMKGEISATSRIGEGTAFTIQLPLCTKSEG